MAGTLISGTRSFQVRETDDPDVYVLHVYGMATSIGRRDLDELIHVLREANDDYLDDEDGA
jgi:hypothetical protein